MSIYTSNEFGNILNSHNISHIKIATASPQSNGQVERKNPVIIPLLAKIFTDNGWDLKLNEAEFAINNSKNRSINNTPSIEAMLRILSRNFYNQIKTKTEIYYY